MMAKHDEARARVDSALELALNNNLPLQAAMAYRVLADLRDFKADYAGARDAQLHAITFCRRQGTVSVEHMCLSCLGYVLFRTGQWRSAIENARKVLANENAHSATRAFMATVLAMISVLRGERRHGNARLAEALCQLRANNVVILEFFALWVRGAMANLEGNQLLAAAQYRELLSLWHETEDRMFAVPGVVSAAGFYADQRDGVNLAACCEILSVIAQENRNEETRAGSQTALAETARSHGDLTSAVALCGLFLTAIGADIAQIEASFRKAISTADGQKSISPVKRAEATYAEYRRQRAKALGGHKFRLAL